MGWRKKSWMRPRFLKPQARDAAALAITAFILPPKAGQQGFSTSPLHPDTVCLVYVFNHSFTTVFISTVSARATVFSLLQHQRHFSLALLSPSFLSYYSDNNPYYL